MNKTLKHLLFILVLFIIAFCMYGIPNFYAPDETRYSEVAREMLASHNFIVPHIDGMIFFHKPPVVYWVTCIFMSIFGENTWGARLVNPVLLCMCLMFTYFILNKIFKCRQITFLSVLISLTTILFLFLGRYLNIDLAIAVFLNMTILSYWMSLKYDDDYKKSTFWLLVAFVFAGIAVMTKGLMGIVFPIAIVGLYSILMGQYKRLFDIRLYIGLVIVVAISLPWILAVEKYHPNFAYYYIVVQQILRYSTDDQNRDVGKVIYLLAILGALFPWSFFLPQVLKSFCSKQAFKARKQNCDKWFLFVWAGFIFVFFGVSQSFLFGYLAPLILPLGILIALEIKKMIDVAYISKWNKISFALPILVFGLLPIVVTVVLCLPMYQSLFAQFAMFLIPIALVSIIIVIKSIKALKQNNVKNLVCYFSLMMVVIANFGYAAGEYFDYANTPKIANDISQIYEKYPQAKTFESDRYYDIPFYTKKNVIIINDNKELDDIRDFHNSGTDKYLMDYNKFLEYWNNSHELNLLVVKNSSLAGLPWEYEKKIDKTKLFVLDKTKAVTLVASKDITKEFA